MASKTDVENARREVRGVYARKIMALEAERNALVDAMRGIVDRLTSAVRDGDSTRVVRALEIARASLPLPPSPAAGGAK